MVKPVAKLISMLTPKRRWAQFSLLTLFLVVTVLCVGLRLVVVPAQRQRRAVAAIKAIGGSVEYFDPDLEPDPKASEAFPRSFLRRLLPRDYVDTVRVVDLDSVEDPEAGLAHLHGLTGLRSIDLCGTRVTDSGLAHVQGLTGLRSVNLGATDVTDAALTNLQGLTWLDELHLQTTQVTKAGLTALRQALPKAQIMWGDFAPPGRPPPPGSGGGTW